MIKFLQQQLPGIPVRFCLILTFLLHISCAWFSEGYYNPDEHFQILEFASFKLGLSPASELAWEYPAKIRPAVQPAMTFIVYRIAMKLHAANPFIVAFMLRLFTSIVAWFVTFALCMIGLRWLTHDIWKKTLFLLSCFFWFSPFFHCRFSSENCAGIVFFSAFIMILWTPFSIATPRGRRLKEMMRFMAAGFLLGFAFFFRFQMGVAVIGLWLWLLVCKKTSWGELLCLIMGFCMSCCLNIGIDRWFYGSWVLTPVNYFSVNIVKGISDEFGTSPWWYYLVKLLTTLAPPLSIFLIAGILLTWFKRPKNPLVWISIPFFLMHCVVGHKEFRFLFPLLYALPALLVVGVDSLWPSLATRVRSSLTTKIIKLCLLYFIVFDIALLIGYSFKPAKETIKMYKWIYKEGMQRPFSLLALGGSPFTISDLSVNFYRSSHVTVIRTNDPDSLKRLINEARQPAIVWTASLTLPDSLKEKLTEWNAVCRTVPQWLPRFFIDHRLLHARQWTIYSVKKLL